MASGKRSTRSQRKYNSIRIALASAVLEWLLICMLFVDAILSYLITKFASYWQLQTPCLLCSRLDHILGNRKLKYYWDLICTTHKLEISSLVLCHAHNNLVDVHGMCERCLFSLATTNKSNSETHRLLVGKLGDDSSANLNENPVLKDHESSSHRCSCCNEPWVPRGYSQKLLRTKTVDFEADDSDALLPGDDGNYKDNLQKMERSVSVRDTRINKGFDHLSHVGYTEINVNSDKESEAVFSDDDRQINFKKEDLGPPQTEAHKVFLPNDLANEKITDGVTSPQSPTSVSQVKSDSAELHGVSSVLPTAAMGFGSRELHWQQADPDVKSDPSVLPELSSLGEIPSPSIAKDIPVEASTENKFKSMDDVPPSFDVEKTLAEESKERVLISLKNVPSSSDAGATPVEASEKSELISVDDTFPSTESKEAAEQISIEDKHVSLVNVFPSSIAKDIPVEAAKENKLNSLDDVPLSFYVEETLFEESKKSMLISTKNVPSSPSDARGSPVEATEKSELISLYDTVPSSESKENLTQKSTEDKLDSLADLVPLSSEVETPVQGLKEKCVARTEEIWQAVVTDNEDMARTESPTVAGKTSETIPLSGDTVLQVPKLLDLSEAYKLAVGNKGRQLSGVLAEQWTGKDKDSSKVSDDLKLILSQLSVAREQLTNDASPRVTISPRVSMSPRFSVNSEEMKNLEVSIIGKQLLQKRISLERNESDLSLDGSIVSEIEGETVVDRLNRQVEHDKKLLSALYKELEEERNASAIAANQAMAMITRLQEEKATLQMEALQCLRMMEEQAEYDMEALQKTNDLLAEREKEIQELEMELEFYRNNCTSESLLVEDTKKQNEELSEATTVEVSSTDTKICKNVQL